MYDSVTYRSKLAATTMTIHLGTIYNGETENKIEFGEIISEEQRDALINSLSEIGNIDSNRRLYELVFENKNEFITALNRDSIEMVKSSLSIQGNRNIYDKYYSNFNRLFLNYISSIQTYLDHNETYVHRKFGNKSYEAIRFKTWTSQCFDNYFSYRFFYKLRNYAVHCVLPLQEFNLSVEREGDGARGSLKIEFKPETLLANYNEWGKVKNDLQKFTDNFSLIPLIEEMTKILLDFFMFINILSENNVRAAVIYIRQMTDHLRAKDTDICIFSDIVKNTDDNKLNFSVKHIPFDIVDQLDV